MKLKCCTMVLVGDVSCMFLLNDYNIACNYMYKCFFKFAAVPSFCIHSEHFFWIGCSTFVKVGFSIITAVDR